MKFLRHMSENLFITFTGIAALVHSTWSLGTMFSGVAPSGDLWAYLGWVIPAFMVAFAMDVGQISTSAAIRHNGLTWQRAVTFCVFAVATYYLQFLYIAHHLPLLELAKGLSEVHRENVKTSVDAAIWILPLFLPLSTILYTLSGGDKKEQTKAQMPDFIIEKHKTEELPALEQPEQHNDFVPFVLNLDNPLLPDFTQDESSDVANLLIEQPLLAEWQIEGFVSECVCGRVFRGSSQEQADRALRAHRVHCKRGQE